MHACGPVCVVSAGWRERRSVGRLRWVTRCVSDPRRLSRIPRSAVAQSSQAHRRCRHRCPTPVDILVPSLVAEDVACRHTRSQGQVRLRNILRVSSSVARLNRALSGAVDAPTTQACVARVAATRIHRNSHCTAHRGTRECARLPSRQQQQWCRPWCERWVVVLTMSSSVCPRVLTWRVSVQERTVVPQMEVTRLPVPSAQIARGTHQRAGAMVRPGCVPYLCCACCCSSTAPCTARVAASCRVVLTCRAHRM